MTGRRDPRPVVGIVGHGHLVPRPFGDLPVVGAPAAYVDALGACGMRPLLLPGGHACDLLDLVDALVLTGGGDLDPRLSGADPGGAAEVDPARDRDELAVAAAAAELGVPTLGVCRGLQVLVVARGGTLRGGIEHRLLDGHDVRTAPGSLVRTLLGPVARTTALHRQAVDDPGPAWRATAWAGDVIEAVEPALVGTGRAWPVLGVQWHPEMDGVAGFRDPTGAAVLGWLGDAARAYRRPRGRREHQVWPAGIRAPGA